MSPNFGKKVPKIATEKWVQLRLWRWNGSAVLSGDLSVQFSSVLWFCFCICFAFVFALLLLWFVSFRFVRWAVLRRIVCLALL